MRTLPDLAAEPGHEQPAVHAAFGLSLEVDSRIDVVGLGAPAATRPGAASTRVLLDPDEVERRWSAVGADARRMRELRSGESVVLSVDLAEPAGYLLAAAGVGRALVSSDGTEVLCDPHVDGADWTFILPAQVLPLASTLRGYEVLHAAGLVIGGKATLLSGEPGAGKSSLAAALLHRGVALLSDDCVALELCDGALLAHPGAGVLYLRQPENDRILGEERDSLGVGSPFAGKHRYEPARAGAPAPFGALFLLERAAEGPAIERIEDVDPFDLLAATFNLSVRTEERLIRQLDVVEQLIATERIFRLRVIPGTNATQLAEAVECHLDSLTR